MTLCHRSGTGGAGDSLWLGSGRLSVRITGQASLEPRLCLCPLAASVWSRSDLPSPSPVLSLLFCADGLLHRQGQCGSHVHVCGLRHRFFSTKCMSVSADVCLCIVCAHAETVTRKTLVPACVGVPAASAHPVPGAGCFPPSASCPFPAPLAPPLPKDGLQLPAPFASPGCLEAEAQARSERTLARASLGSALPLLVLLPGSFPSWGAPGGVGAPVTWCWAHRERRPQRDCICSGARPSQVWASAPPGHGGPVHLGRWQQAAWPAGRPCGRPGLCTLPVYLP